MLLDAVSIGNLGQGAGKREGQRTTRGARRRYGARKRAAVYLPITSRQLADGTVEIAPSGEIDLDNAHIMRDAVNEALSSTANRICLDLQRVMLIDSIGIGILVACFHAAAASGVKLVVSHPSPTVYRQLWVSGLVGLLGCAEPPSPRTSVGLRPA
jgi:anti-anti-sigma factor